MNHRPVITFFLFYIPVSLSWCWALAQYGVRGLAVGVAIGATTAVLAIVVVVLLEIRAALHIVLAGAAAAVRDALNLLNSTTDSTTGET